MNDWIKEIIVKTQIEKETKENVEERFYVIEGESKIGGVEERYFIYDCSENDYEFDYEKYKAHMEEEEGISYPIIIFRNWEHEWKTRKSIYDNLEKAIDKKNLLRYFEKKISFYTDLNNLIVLDVEELGRNYLQYDMIFSDIDLEGKKALSGRIYNVAFSELRKLFNITGKDLFQKNVRSGLKNNRTGNEIKFKFKEYIRTGAYYAWINEHIEEKNDEKVKSIFDIAEDSNIRKPEAFWFFHNGITIFYFGKNSIDYSSNQIKFNPKEVSVINGAQTMTNYFEGLKEIELEFKNTLLNMLDEQEKRNDIEEFFKKYISEVDKKIRVKTIFIDGDESYVQPITYGLNTQIPIVEADIIADSAEVDVINSHLKKGKIKILKEGEVASIGSGMSVLEFVKKYLIIEAQPGKSKNLKRSDIKMYVQQANEKLEKATERIINDFQNLEIIEMWWKSGKQSRESTYLDRGEKIYIDYGKNYFESFVLKEKKEELEEDYLELLLDKFINVFLKLKSDPEIQTFKNDDLFKEYLNNHDSSQNVVSLDKTECDKLMEYLNNSDISNYSVQKEIAEYLKSIQKEYSYFRVIARTKQKVREAFPFASTTFSDLYQGEINGNEASGDEKHYKKYKDSCFKKEVEKQIPIFVIDWEMISEYENKRIAKAVKYIPDFTFSKFTKEAEEVYNLTVKAFENGDEKAFPKMGDKKQFHVRPKAINADDTFEFSNGNQITKRTFWANKETVDSLLDEYFDKSLIKK